MKLLGVVPYVRTVRTASVLTAVQIVWFSHHAARRTSSRKITKTGHRDRTIGPSTITAADSSPADRRAASTYFTADQLHTKLSQVRFWPETRPSKRLIRMSG